MGSRIRGMVLGCLQVDAELSLWYYYYYYYSSYSMSSIIIVITAAHKSCMKQGSRFPQLFFPALSPLNKTGNTELGSIGKAIIILATFWKVEIALVNKWHTNY